MKRKSFDWDRHFATAQYSEIASSSPDLSSRRHPTAYSPDRNWIYLSSQDLDIETDNREGLTSIFSLLSESYKNSKKSEDHRKLSLVKIDFFAVCELLQALVESPEDYDDPDHLLVSQ